EEAHSFDIDFENRNIGAEAGAHARGVDPGGSAAEDDDAAGKDAGHAAEEHAFAAVVLGEEVAADEHAHASGDFAHGLEQGQAAIYLDGFVGDRSAAGLRQSLRQRPVGGEVEIGKEDLAGTKQAVLGGEWLLDLNDHLRALEDVLECGHNLRAGCAIFVVTVA